MDPKLAADIDKYSRNGGIALKTLNNYIALTGRQLDNSDRKRKQVLRDHSERALYNEETGLNHCWIELLDCISKLQTENRQLHEKIRKLKPNMPNKSCTEYTVNFDKPGPGESLEADNKSNNKISPALAFSVSVCLFVCMGAICGTIYYFLQPSKI